MKRKIGLFSQELAQATVEYVLMLAIAVSLFVAVTRNFIRPAFDRLGQSLDARVRNLLFNTENLHRFKLRR